MELAEDATRAKLSALVDLLGVDHLSGALGLDIEAVRSMRDGIVDITPEAASWIDVEVLRLESVGLWVDVPEILEPEDIESEDVVVETTPTPPEVDSKSLDGSRPSLKGMVEIVHDQLVLMMAQNNLPDAQYELARVLKCRLALELHFRRPFENGETGSRRRQFLDSIKRQLRNAEEEIHRHNRRLLRRGPPLDATGDSLYQRLVIEYSNARNIDPDFALQVGINQIGRFVHPEWFGTSVHLLRRLSDRERSRGEAYVDAINLAEEVQFRCPLPCEEDLAASYIKLYMEVALMVDLGVSPTLYDTTNSLLEYPNEPAARQEKRRFIQARMRRYEGLTEESRKCRRFRGMGSVEDFFNGLITESGAEHLKQLKSIILLDIHKVCYEFLEGRDLSGLFAVPDLPPLSDG